MISTGYRLECEHKQTEDTADNHRKQDPRWALIDQTCLHSFLETKR